MISDVPFPLVVIAYLISRSLSSWITVLSNSFFLYYFDFEEYLLLKFPVSKKKKRISSPHLSYIIPSFWIRHCIFSLTILTMKIIPPSVGLLNSFLPKLAFVFTEWSNFIMRCRQTSDYGYNSICISTCLLSFVSFKA